MFATGRLTTGLRPETCFFGATVLWWKAAFTVLLYFSGRIKSGTGYTLAFAQKNGCEIINLYDDLAE